jgi:hypothetical protein
MTGFKLILSGSMPTSTWCRCPRSKGPAAHPLAREARDGRPYKISDDLAERGVKLSHVIIGKIITGRLTPLA